MSLRTRLDLLVSGLLLLMLLSTLYVSTWRQNQQSLQEQQLALNATVTALNQALKTPFITRDYATIEAIGADVFDNSDLTMLFLADAQGHVLMNLKQPRDNKAVPSWFKRWFVIYPPVSTATISAGGVDYGELSITGNSSRLYASLWMVATHMSLIALLTYAILNLSVWWMLRRGFRPLDLLQQAAEKLAKGIREPINEKVVSEFRLPIQAFNQMSGEISRLIVELVDKRTDLEIFAQAIECLSEGVVILQQDLSIKYCNPFAIKLQQDIPTLMQLLNDMLDQHLSHQLDATLHVATDIQADQKGSGKHTLDILINSVHLPHSEAMYYVIVVRDITEEREQKSKLAWEATHDLLTSTLNRFEFAKRLNEHISGGHAGMLLFVDLDHFKRVNDSYGHSVGDQLLKHVAEGISRKLPKTSVLARFGGDEFLILLKHHTLEQGTGLAGDLLSAIPEMKLVYNGQLLNATTSIGGIYFDANTQLSAEMLISHTDATMFEAKQTGRNRLAIFAHAMPEMARIRVDQEWMDRLTTALEQKRFMTLYQPTLRLEDGVISHYEALARLESKGKILDAAHFIPHAERLGLVGEIDVLILRSVMQCLSRNPKLVIASNISGYSLNNAHLQNRLFEILEQNSHASSRLIFEITESTAIDEISEAKNFIRKARLSGCRFAIDDFGVGYSSLQTLSQLDVDYLKIDGSLLKNLHSENTALLRAVQGLADALHIPTVAEHVDTEEKLEVVRRIGINYAQGYLIGRAASPEQFISKIVTRSF